VLGHAYALAGDARNARALVDELLKAKQKREIVDPKRKRQVIIDPSAFALIHLGLGEKDQAFDWLDKAYEYRPPNLTLIKTHPY
jgi:serine/threonine-protein kinase